MQKMGLLWEEKLERGYSIDSADVSAESIENNAVKNEVDAVKTMDG